MPIAIDGSGTITGITSGGLPDNIITNAELADDAVAIADLAATGTPSATTFLRGDNSWAEAGGGKILQVLQSTLTDVSTTSTKETWLDIAGTDQAGSGSIFCVKITPTAATSKILFSTSLHYSTTNNNTVAIGLYRDSTLILQGDASTNKMRATSMMYETDDINMQLKHLQYLDSPNSTSELTYKQMHYTYNTDTFYINRSDRDYAGIHYDHRCASTLTVMEVGA